MNLQRKDNYGYLCSQAENLNGRIVKCNFSYLNLFADELSMKAFGDVLRQAREECGLTQAELAGRANITRVYVGLLERGKKTPTLDVYGRLCKAMKIAPSKLMERFEKNM